MDSTAWQRQNMEETRSTPSLENLLIVLNQIAWQCSFIPSLTVSQKCQCISSSGVSNVNCWCDLWYDITSVTEWNHWSGHSPSSYRRTPAMTQPKMSGPVTLFVKCWWFSLCVLGAKPLSISIDESHWQSSTSPCFKNILEEIRSMPSFTIQRKSDSTSSVIWLHDNVHSCHL